MYRIKTVKKKKRSNDEWYLKETSNSKKTTTCQSLYPKYDRTCKS